MVEINLVSNPNFFRQNSARALGKVFSPNEKPLMQYGGKFIVNHHAVNTDPLMTDLVVLLQNMKKKFMMRVPLTSSDKKIAATVARVIEDLRTGVKQSYDDVIGFVTGGHEYDASIPYIDRGKDIIDRLAETLKDERVPVTILAQQKNIGKDEGVSVYAVRDFVNVYGGRINEMKAINNSEKECVSDALDELFDYAEVSEYVPVKFIGDIGSWERM